MVHDAAGPRQTLSAGGDDELADATEAQRVMQFKREIFAEERPISRTVAFARSGGVRTHAMFGDPLRDRQGRVGGVLTVGFKVPAAAAVTDPAAARR